jgi:hypothetical protein
MKPVPEVRPIAAAVICAVGIIFCGMSLGFKRSRPPPPPESQEDAALRFKWGVLRGATSEALGRLDEQLSTARSALPAADSFDAWLAMQDRGWTTLASATDHYPGLEVRRLVLAYNHPTLRAWSDIVETAKALCAEPGLSVDSLSLSAAPDGSDAFVQAQITLTARLRP